MAGEAVEKKLYNAASKGDVTTLVELVEEDPFLVHGVLFPYSRNLLHIATMHGQTSIVEQLLSLDPQLACTSDSQKSSPLHIAAARGHVEIASKLVSVAPEMCWWRDEQGMNPVHVAAMNGHVEILEHLLLESSLPAMERLHRGQTVLHLCVKHAQLRVLKFLAEKLGDLVCTKDDDGDTLLHLAVRCNQLETIQYLVENKGVEQETRNGMGKTAFQILHESHPNSVNYLEMKKLLIDPLMFGFVFSDAIPEMNNTMIVVAVLIATMAFQSAINPPGGVWSADYDKASHKAGHAVMASIHPDTYMNIMNANTAAFMCCLTGMFFFCFKIQHAVYPYFFLWVSMYAMGTALIAIMITFFESMDAITPTEVMKSKGNNATPVVMMVMGILGAIPLCVVGLRNLYRLWLKKKRQQVHLAADAFPLRLRLLYWTSQQLDMHTIFRALR